MSLSNKLKRAAHAGIEGAFRPLEHEALTSGTHLQMIPAARARRGSTTTYIEWGYTVGFFQPLIFQNLPSVRPVKILDVGSGVGLLGIACSPYLLPGDEYVGIDARLDHVEFSKKHYRDPRFSFIHFERNNWSNSPGQSRSVIPWPIARQSCNLVLALSVWTHMREPDARYYMKEVGRLLRDGGRALISFFVLDSLYTRTVGDRVDQVSRFYPELETKWIFDTPIAPSTDWFCPSWATDPDEAIAINQPALYDMIAEAGLSIVQLYPGAWKEYPGLFFQDIAVLSKP